VGFVLIAKLDFDVGCTIYLWPNRIFEMDDSSTRFNLPEALTSAEK